MDAGPPVRQCSRSLCVFFEASKKWLYSDFQALFEFQLEAFVESQPFTQEDFLAACQDALDSGAGGGDSYAHDAAGFSASIVNMVLMTSTYDFFVRVMIAAAAQEKLRRNLASMCASQPTLRVIRWAALTLCRGLQERARGERQRWGRMIQRR